DQRSRGVYQNVVGGLDVAMGRGSGNAEALLPGQQTLTMMVRSRSVLVGPGDSHARWRNDMRAYLLGGLIICGLLLGAGRSSAHHSFTAEFDANKPITLTGTVTKVEWTNPHVWFYINVKDETGKVTNWGMEMGGPNGLLRAGWTRNSMKAGDEVTVDGFKARSGKPLGNATS